MWQKKVDLNQTIFALCTGDLPSAVAVVRLTGPSVFDVAKKIFAPANETPLARQRGMWFGELKELDGTFLDDVLALGFVAPRSFTGEDTLEFQCHGSRAIVDRLFIILGELGCRQASKGEFSYRAFVNGKLNAHQLDLMGDLYQARTGSDLSSIYARKDGALERRILSLRDKLIQVQAILDTAVDFTDEYSAVTQTALTPISEAIHECSLITHRYSRFQHGSNSPKIVLCGQANAGKSSLFNSLLNRQRAIVHAEPGTTRDVVEEHVVTAAGLAVTLVDTAGIREGVKGPEKDGIEFGQEFLHAASAWILVVDGTVGLSPGDKLLLDRLKEKPGVVVWNKSDQKGWLSTEKPMDIRVFNTSCELNQGVDEVFAWIEAHLKSQSLDSLPIPTASQYAELKKAAEELAETKAKLEQGAPPEFVAEENRRVIGRLESLMGSVDTEQVLDRVFGEFCIGK